jgi:hypothetical protein
MKLKPPVMKTGSDNWGSFVEIMGSEAIGELKVRPTSTANQADNSFTELGDVVLDMPIMPAFLNQTRVGLLMRNFNQYKVCEFKVRGRKLTNALTGGGFAAVLSPDINANFSIGSTAVQRVNRLLDYQGAKSFNSFNDFEITAPRLPPDTEPAYTSPGYLADKEGNYKLTIISLGSIDPQADEDVLVSHWIEFNYCIRLYDTVLPILSVDDREDLFDLTTGTAANWFVNPAAEAVLQLDPSHFGIDKTTDLNKIILVYCEQTPTDAFPVELSLKNSHYGSFFWEKGMIMYSKAQPNELSGDIYFPVYASVDDAIIDNNPIYFETGVAVGTMTTGLLRLALYDEDPIL